MYTDDRYVSQLKMCEKGKSLVPDNPQPVSK
jgi:hypothetical protein